MADASAASVPADVHVGRDGWLFWVGRPDVILPLYRYRPATWLRLHRWRRVIDARVRRARSLGCRFVEVIVPDKLSVYDDRLLSPIVDARLAPMLRLGRAVARRHPDAWVDLLGPFRAGRDGAPLYLRTDTHWSRAGYLLAYRIVCDALGARAMPHVLEAPLETVHLVNDIGNKFTPQPVEAVDVPAMAARAERIEANALVQFREAQPVHVVGTSVGSRVVSRASGEGVDPRRVVVFGDSYTFHWCGLGQMLGETFSELHCLWSSSIDWAYVERVRPDVVIHELAERFLFRLPVDGVDNEAFAAERLREARARVGEGGLSPA